MFCPSSNCKTKFDTTYPSMCPFHCIPGCDTVSCFYNHGKKSAWKVFIDNTKTLEEFGTGSDTDFPSQLKIAEIYIVKIYSPKSKLTSLDSLRAAMFNKVDPESKGCHV